MSTSLRGFNLRFIETRRNYQRIIDERLAMFEHGELEPEPLPDFSQVLQQPALDIPQPALDIPQLPQELING